MSSSEQLVAFLDGELNPEETTTLFYELANNPELQEEMRQYVQIRNAFRNSQIAPPPELKSNIMQAVGFVEPSSNGVAYISKRISALLIALFYNKISLSIFIIAFLSIVGYLMYNTNDSNNPISNEKYSTHSDNYLDIKSSENNKENRIENENIPIISSFSSGIDNLAEDDINRDKQNNNSSKVNNNSSSNSLQANSTNQKSKLSNFSKDKITSNNSKNILSNNSENIKIAEDSRNNISNANLILNENTLSDNTLLNNELYHTIEQSNLPNNAPIMIRNNERYNLNKLRYNSGNYLDNIMQNTELNITKRMTSIEPNINLANESSHIINDLSIELKYNLDAHHSIGIAYGLENFKMTFDKDIDGVIYRYNQSWDAGWLALSYQYKMSEIYGTGLIPSVNLLAGATSVGPLIRAGAGLNYFITDNFYLNAGFDSATLIFEESQSNNSDTKWFTSNKLGWNFGFGIGF